MIDNEFVNELRIWKNKETKESFIRGYKLLSDYDIPKDKIMDLFMDLHNAIVWEEGEI